MKRSSSDAIRSLCWRFVSDGESEAGAADLLQEVKEKLYTTAGLRSLEMEDPAFHPWIGGSQPERDRAYHQGQYGDFHLGRISVRC